MEDALSLFQFVKSKNIKSQFIDVKDFLSDIGYPNFSVQNQFLDNLKKEGYIERNDHPLSPFATTSQYLSRIPNHSYKMMIRLTYKADEYLSNRDRFRQEQQATRENLRNSRRTALATWASVFVAFASLIVNVVQCASNKEKDSRIAGQDSTIIELQSKVSKLLLQKDSLSAFTKERKLLPEKTSSTKVIKP